MPVSKKRKKDGKPVKAHVPPPEHEGHTPALDAKPEHAASRAGKPSNPFVAKQMVRGAQRGR